MNLLWFTPGPSSRQSHSLRAGLRPGRRRAARLLLAAVVLGIGLPAQAQSRMSTSQMRSEISRLSANDQRQDIRLLNLEKDVDYLNQKVNRATGATATASAKSAKEPVLPTPTTTYKVRSGETLWRIAMNHHVSPGEIMSLNNMKTDKVAAGQTLKIPSRSAPVPVQKPSAIAPVVKTTPSAPAPAPAAGSTHTVKKGETFSQIAAQYGISQAALQQANPGVNPNLIQIGARLNLPAAAPAKPVPPPPAPAPVVETPPAPAVTTTAAQSHTVRPGDTLSSIASQHKVSLSALQAANRMQDPNRLVIGQVLTIPATAAAPIPPSPAPATPSPAPQTAPAPQVPSGLVSTLQSPAAKVESPGPAPQVNHRGVLSYRVHSTDTIESIASTFGTTPEKIREINRKPPGSKVVPDEEILVPGIGAVGLQP